MPTTPTPTPRSPGRTAKTAPTPAPSTSTAAPATGKDSARAATQGAAKSASRSSKTTRSRAAEAITPVKVIDQDHRRALIAKAAYFRAERRNFAPGFETEDWLSAETEVDTLLTQGVATVDS